MLMKPPGITPSNKTSSSTAPERFAMPTTMALFHQRQAPCPHSFDNLKIVKSRDTAIDDRNDNQPEQAMLNSAAKYIDFGYQPAGRRQADQRNQAEA